MINILNLKILLLFALVIIHYIRKKTGSLNQDNIYYVLIIMEIQKKYIMITREIVIFSLHQKVQNGSLSEIYY